MAKRAKSASPDKPLPRSKLAETVAAAVERDSVEAKLRSQLAETKAKYKHALAKAESLESRIQTLSGLADIKAARPVKPKAKHRGDATAILAFSDWHIEEFVDGETVSGPGGARNHYDLTIAEARVQEMMRRALRLLEHEGTLAKIRRVVVFCGGDFISGDIHEDTPTQLPPLAATRLAGQWLTGCIAQLAAIYPEVIVVTSNGNHGRTTKKPSISCDHLLSYEHNLYCMMAAQNTLPNVHYQLGVGYHNWLDIDGFRVRFHHGQAIKSNGAIGGISISANKAIAQWNRMDKADLDVFGHHHQFSWSYGRFVSNASLIGWNAFANFIKAEYQPPSQTLIVVDKDRGVTKALPIFVT